MDDIHDTAAALWHVAEEAWFAARDRADDLVASRLLVDVRRQRLETAEATLAGALESATGAREDYLHACTMHEILFAAWCAAREAA